MKTLVVLASLAYISLHINTVRASLGDTLEEFKTCLQKCYDVMDCDHVNIFLQIQQETMRQEAEFDQKMDTPSPQLPPENVDPEHDFDFIEKRGTSDSTDSSANIAPIDETLFKTQYKLWWLTKNVFHWDCKLDCNYKCQRLVTSQRKQEGRPVVQFYGKWPFIRVFGITELMLTLFSLGNLYVNWLSLPKILNQYNKNGKNGHEAQVQYTQYLYAIIGSMVGWIFSTIFHMRDTGFTETLDYFGAAGITILNFNSITVRFFELFTQENQFARQCFHICLVFTYIGHCVKLNRHWDYTYNIYFNLVFGFASLILWIAHSARVYSTYLKSPVIYNNSLQLLPFETRILAKLGWLSVSKTKLIPILPILLNMWLVIGLSFELLDFVPWFGLVDAHSLWHLFTIFPPIVWYDWNIWDIELMKMNSVSKLS